MHTVVRCKACPYEEIIAIMSIDAHRELMRQAGRGRRLRRARSKRAAR